MFDYQIGTIGPFEEKPSLVEVVDLVLEFRIRLPLEESHFARQVHAAGVQDLEVQGLLLPVQVDEHVLEFHIEKSELFKIEGKPYFPMLLDSLQVVLEINELHEEGVLLVSYDHVLAAELHLNTFSVDDRLFEHSLQKLHVLSSNNQPHITL